MTTPASERADVARRADIWGVLSYFGLEYTPPVQRIWPCNSMRWTSITRCPVCAHELWVDNTTHGWMCETCRDKGDVICLVQHATGCTAQRAIAWLSGYASMPGYRSKSARQHALAKTRRLEDVARRYGLTITETIERPEPCAIPGCIGWAPDRWGGKTFVTTCPVCQGPLFIYIAETNQFWACRTCNHGHSSRECGMDGDAIDLVRHLSGCTFNRAVWYLGGGGPQPKRKIGR